MLGSKIINEVLNQGKGDIENIERKGKTSNFKIEYTIVEAS